MSIEQDQAWDIPEHLNTTSFFLDENIVQGRGNRVAIYFRDETYTYDDLSRLTNRVGNVLKELGVEIENRVYISLEDSPEFVASYYAVQKIGASAIAAYTYLSPSDFEYEINLLKPKVIVADSSSIGAIREATQGSPYPKAFLILGVSPNQLRKREYEFKTLVNHASSQLEAERTHRDDYARWGFTGGSTGHPKAIPVPHSNLVYSFFSIQQIMNYTQADIILPVPKMFFGYGRTGSIVLPFRVGAAAILFPERTTEKKIFELVARHKPTILIQVPTLMRRMLQVPQEERADLSGIRLCTSGGETLSPELYREWRRHFGCEVINVLGSAEMGYIYLSNRPGEVVPGSVGKPVPGYEAKVVDEQGRELPRGEIGVLMAKGPTSAFFYWHEPEKSRQTFRGEWVYTGDLFKKDEEGNFWFIGRADDLLKVSGIWLSPMEIERCIQAHADVVDCAVVGIKDADGLDLPKAFVILREGLVPSQEKADELKKYAKEHLSPYKFPRQVEFLSDLPKNPAGKVDKAELKQRGLTGGSQDYRVH